MTEGELKKRILGRLKTLCVHSPVEDEHGKITQEVHPSSRLPDSEEIAKVLDEAKKDFFPVKPIWSMKYLQERLKNDGTLTQMEEAFIKQTIKIMKWFGENEE